MGPYIGVALCFLFPVFVFIALRTSLRDPYYPCDKPGWLDIILNFIVIIFPFLFFGIDDGRNERMALSITMFFSPLLFGIMDHRSIILNMKAFVFEKYVFTFLTFLLWSLCLYIAQIFSSHSIVVFSCFFGLCIASYISRFGVWVINKGSPRHYAYSIFWVIMTSISYIAIIAPHEYSFASLTASLLDFGWSWLDWCMLIMILVIPIVGGIAQTRQSNHR